jgi:hypothetical protein
VAQVAAAMNEKLSQPNTSIASEEGHKIVRKSSLAQGRAFAAPRLQSLERIRAAAADVKALGKELDASPRRYLPNGDKKGSSPYRQQPTTPGHTPAGKENSAQLHTLYRMRSDSNYVYATPPGNTYRNACVLTADKANEIKRSLRRMRSSETQRSHLRYRTRAPEINNQTQIARTTQTGIKAGARSVEDFQATSLRSLGKPKRKPIEHNHETILNSSLNPGPSTDSAALAEGFRARLQEAAKERQAKTAVVTKKGSFEKWKVGTVAPLVGGWFKNVASNGKMDNGNNWI